MFERWLCLLFPVRPGEISALLLSFAYFFCLLCAYYVLRPIRDEMGIQGGVDNLPWLFTATFVAMLCVVPLFGWLCSRYARARLLPIVYGFFILNILAFYILSRFGLIDPRFLARGFFVWVSVFNLFVVSVFWSFMVDLFDNQQSKRLFGIIAAGGSAGAILGPAITTLLVKPLGTANLLLVSALFLCCAMVCIHHLRTWARQQKRTAPFPLGGGMFEGFRRVFRSPYLLGVGGYILAYTTLSTFLYFTQAEIIHDTFTRSEDRTQIFALMDLATNILTVGLQLFVTGRIVTHFGLAFTLVLVPAIAVVGFIALSFYPILAVIVVVQVLRRAGNYALSRPAREMLFSVLPREDKYKSKNLVDTVIYRGGDALSGWAHAALSAAGLLVSGIAAVGTLIGVGWFLIGWKLGKSREAMETRTKDPENTVVQTIG